MNCALTLPKDTGAQPSILGSTLPQEEVFLNSEGSSLRCICLPGEKGILQVLGGKVPLSTRSPLISYLQKVTGQKLGDLARAPCPTAQDLGSHLQLAER